MIRLLHRVGDLYFEAQAGLLAKARAQLGSHYSIKVSFTRFSEVEQYILYYRAAPKCLQK
jgi:hypothetical protein